MAAVLFIACIAVPVQAASLPNDPMYLSVQWGLHNTSAEGGISAETAWEISTGDDRVIVALLDSGVDIEHPDIKDHIWTNPNEIPNNNIDDDNNGYVDDVHGWNFILNSSDVTDYVGHGTHCAGVIGAVANNGIGIAGTAWNVTILPLVVGDCLGKEHVDSVIAAIQYAADNNADILSMSFGNRETFDPAVKSSAYRDAFRVAGEKGILCVASAGNDGEDNEQIPHYPGSFNYTNILTVAASNWTNNLTVFSNWGLTSVDIAAPGENICSTIPAVYSKNITISDFSLPGIETLGDSWHIYGDTKSAEIYGPGRSLIYFSQPISSNELNRTLTISLRGCFNLSENENCHFKYLISNRSFSTYDSITEITENMTGIYEALKEQCSTVPMNGEDEVEALKGTTLSKDAMGIGDGPYYIGIYYSSDQPNNYLKLTKMVFIYDYEIRGHTYLYASGTSMATPMVSGAVSIMKAVNPSISPEQIIDIIMETVDTYPAMEGKIKSGGRLNLTAALEKECAELEAAPGSNNFSRILSQFIWSRNTAVWPIVTPPWCGLLFAGRFSEKNRIWVIGCV